MPRRVRLSIPFSISSRGSTMARSEVSDVSALTTRTTMANRLQWWRRRDEHNNTNNGERSHQRDSVVSGPKSPDTPHPPFGNFPSGSNGNSSGPNYPDLTPLQNGTSSTSPRSPDAAHFPSEHPPPFSSRPGTRAGATNGVRFAGQDLEDGRGEGDGSRRRSWRRRSIGSSADGRRQRWYHRKSWIGIRRQLISLFFSGLILSITLAIYLALTLANKLSHEQQSFQVLLILILLITGMFFCHSMVRLCIVLTHPQRHRNEVLPFDYLDASSTQPTHPIRIQPTPGTLGDSDSPSNSPKVPPPAYGLWRYSVRVDPSQFYWVRNEEGVNIQHGQDGRPVPTSEGGVRGEGEGTSGSERPTTSGEPRPRPPSYASDDGVSYVMQAAGGVPGHYGSSGMIQVQGEGDRLPPHPSEVGRTR